MIFEMGANLDSESWDTTKEDKNKKKKEEIKPKNQHQLVFTFEKRKGKPVTLVGRFNLEQNEKKEVLKLLKKKLACGGAIKEDWIEIQGNVKEKIISVLENDGWKFKK